MPVVILALIGAFILGTVGVELIVGGRLVRSTGWAVTSLIGLAVLGAGVLRAVAALELLPGLGIVSVLVGLAVFIFGVGGALMTGFGTRAPCPTAGAPGCGPPASAAQRRTLQVWLDSGRRRLLTPFPHRWRALAATGGQPHGKTPRPRPDEHLDGPDAAR